jgi:hypothetical protein
VPVIPIDSLRRTPERASDPYDVAALLEMT